MTNSPSRDEQWLLTEKYHCENSAAVFTESLDDIKNKYSWGADFFHDCARLRSGEPLAYVIGHVPFLGGTIYLDSHPLIPRPETEFWVEKSINTLKNTLPRKDLGGNLRVLDLCAGSGCIGVAAGLALPSAHITFAELDPAHLPTIEKNCALNGATKNTIVESDLFTNVRGTFNYIFSNPPYIDPALNRAEDSVINYEPHLALYGGASGTELIASIITQAPAYLVPHGELWLEHEPEQVTIITTLGATSHFQVTHHQDQYGTVRYSRLVLQ